MCVREWVGGGVVLLILLWQWVKSPESRALFWGEWGLEREGGGSARGGERE